MGQSIVDFYSGRWVSFSWKKNRDFFEIISKNTKNVLRKFESRFSYKIGLELRYLETTLPRAIFRVCEFFSI